MEKGYPNVYYEQLANLIVKNPSLALKREEVCFYQGRANSFRKVTKVLKGKPQKGKTSFFWTPWFWGINRQKTVEVREETKTEYYSGYLYITNMRIVFKCSVEGFDVMIPKIKSVKQCRDGIKVNIGKKSFSVMTADLNQILYIIDLINKAQR